MLGDAFAFPRADDDWLETVLIGGVLSLLGPLIVPAILLNGYLLRVTAAAVAGEETPPRFDDWGDLFVDGILVWVVQFLYVGVPGFLLALAVASLTVITFVTASPHEISEETATVAGIGVLVALIVLAVLVVLLLVAVFLLPAALANFARTGEFAAAFDLRTIAKGAFSADYVVALLLAVAVSVVLGTVGAILSVVLVGIFLLFYLQAVVYYLFGQGFAAGLGTGDESSGPGR